MHATLPRSLTIFYSMHPRRNSPDHSTRPPPPPATHRAGTARTRTAQRRPRTRARRRPCESCRTSCLVRLPLTTTPDRRGYQRQDDRYRSPLVRSRVHGAVIVSHARPLRQCYCPSWGPASLPHILYSCATSFLLTTRCVPSMGGWMTMPPGASRASDERVKPAREKKTDALAGGAGASRGSGWCRVTPSAAERQRSLKQASLSVHSRYAWPCQLAAPSSGTSAPRPARLPLDSASPAATRRTALDALTLLLPRSTSERKATRTLRKSQPLVGREGERDKVMPKRVCRSVARCCVSSVPVIGTADAGRGTV
mmetsp:Transcript_16309/g.51042  ORF Transcript_16309/g.51042 Transcript_16309/m.51042 type:complete len:311 (+) Transcript_16309:471-1403(+)